jgi:predicted nucleic acid-binding protein
MYLLDTNIISYRMRSDGDTQITSIALANKLCLVTPNSREFGRIAKLKVEDWASK